MPLPSRHRLGPPRSSNMQRGAGTLSQHRGKAPEGRSGSRFVKTAHAEPPQPVTIAPMKKPTPPTYTRSPTKSLTNEDRKRLFGGFSFVAKPTPGDLERIVVNPAWVKENIVTTHNEALAKRGILNLPSRGIELHRLVLPHFQALIAAWDAEGLLSHIKTWHGSYVPRFRRGQAEKQNLSAHSWGSAFDINARWNNFRRIPARRGEEGSVVPLVSIANKLGWVWGGDFSTPDGMHFELGASVFDEK